MSTSSVKPIPTLKGIFSVPKMNHRRDFLRENKLNLRELQRVTNKNKTTQQQEQQQKQHRQQQIHQQQQQLYVNRRSASQQRMTPTKQPSFSQQRSISQQRPGELQTQQHSRCSSCSREGHPDALGKMNSAVSKADSCNKEIQTDDIQDEEFLYEALKKCTSSEFNSRSNTKLHLNDEHHRHSKSEPNVPYSMSTNGDYYNGYNQGAQQQPQHQQQHPQQFQQQLHQHQQEHQQHYQQQHNQQQLQEQQQQHHHHYQQQQQNHLQHHQLQLQQQAQQDLHLKQDTQRSGGDNISHHLQNNDNEAYCTSARVITQRSQQNHMNGHHQPGQLGGDDGIDLQLDNLAIDNKSCGGGQPQQQQLQNNAPLSARSRQTVCSTNSQEGLLAKKKSNGSLHKFGSRDDVRLPRYLEREKREKEEERMREMVRDPNCPIGHYALSNDERLSALATAEKKFKKLVSELNHMPITTQTLRIRTRKAEIEKELAELESDIRIFSKAKVYAKQPEDE